MNHPLLAFLRAWWTRLTEPLPSVRNPRERRQSQLMASLMVAAILIVTAMIFIPKQTTTETQDVNNWHFFGLLVTGTCALCYHWSRRGRYRLASAIIIGISETAVFLPALWIGGSTSYSALFYLGLLPLFGSLFFGVRSAFVITLFNTVALIVLAPYFPGIRVNDVYIGPLSVTVLLGALILLFDIHWRRGETEQSDALKASEERYHIITELISNYAFSNVVEPDGNLTTDWITQDSFSRLTGYQPHELVEGGSRLTFRLYHPDDVEQVQQDVQRSIQGQMTRSECRIITQDGQVRWLQIDRRPVWNRDQSRVERIYGVATDITERKQAEQALKGSEEQYRKITRLISDYTFAYTVLPDGSLDLEWVTETSFTRLTGYTAEDIRTGMFANPVLYAPDDVPAIRAEIQRTIAGEATNAEHRILTKDGQERWIHIYRFPEVDPDTGKVTRFYGVAQNITERKQAELALKASEERYRLISELISDYAYFYRFNPDGSKTREWITGASYMRVTGYTPDELTGEQFSKRIHEDDRERLLRDRQTVSRGEPSHGEYRLLNKDGDTRWLSMDRYPVWDEADTRPIGYYGIAKDITERKQAEADQFRLTLEHEQLTMVNQFVQAVSHDFRTLLSTIETSRYLIERRLEDAARAPVQEKLDMIHNAVSHLTEQLESLHMVSTLGEPSLSRCDLNGLIERLVQQHDLKARQKRIQITFSRDPSLAPIMLDAAKIEQAIGHLLNNAITFTDAGGLIELTTRLDADHSAVIEVRDTGAGIDPDVLPRVFEPFFRGDASRPVRSGGVGLGLTIVRMIVDTHHGEIQVESELGKGTRFCIRLPVTQAV
ncbi:MAG: PAS domain S-box protein, partial [Anaerolineae bacterium]|nr:PAS domain S-box protein [Anaerolineae bacterium]